MLFPVLNHEVEARVGDSERDFLDYLERHELGHLMLGNEEELATSFHSLTIYHRANEPGRRRFGIGIRNLVTGAVPAALLLPADSAILIGHNNSLVCFNLNALSVSRETSLTSWFRSFVQIGLDVILAVQETDVSRINTRGERLWTHGGDLITSTRILGDKIELSFLDMQAVTLDLHSGNVVQT